MRILLPCLCALGLLTASATAAPPPVLAKLLSAKLDPRVRANVAAAIATARQAYAVADRAHALQSNVAAATARADAAAENANNNLPGYGKDDRLFHYAGEITPGGQWSGVGIIRYDEPQGLSIRESDNLFGKITAASGDTLAGEINVSPHPSGEFFAADGDHYAGQYTQFWLPLVKEGLGVFDADAQIAGQFHENQFSGAGIIVMKNGMVLAGKWFDGKLVDYSATFDAKGRLLEQGPYIAGTHAPFTPLTPDLTPPQPLDTPDCNRDDLYPLISRRLHEEGDVTLAFTVGADGAPGQITVWQSSGSTRLDEGALKCLQSWRFLPAKRHGRAVSYFDTRTLQMRVLHPILGGAPVQ